VPQSLHMTFQDWRGSDGLGVARDRELSIGEVVTTSSGFANGLIKNVLLGAPVNSNLNSACCAVNGGLTTGVPATALNGSQHGNCSTEYDTPAGT
jgi:tetrahydromethanopterin S-methyltransferase subunit F